MTEAEQNQLNWERMREGDRDALFALYHQTYFHLVRFGLTVTANDELVKDCVSQLFLQLWGRHQSLPAVTQVRSYLFTALRRMLLDQLTLHSRAGAALHYFADQEDPSELSYEEIIIGVQRDEEMRRKLHLALEQLTPRQKELIRLVFFEGLTYEEVAARTEQSIKTAYNTIYNAIQLLRKLLK